MHTLIVEAMQRFLLRAQMITERSGRGGRWRREERSEESE